MEQRSSETKVSTSQIRLSSSNGETEFRMVLPEIHPGPYHPVGGSNIPYLIYKNLIIISNGYAQYIRSCTKSYHQKMKLKII